MNWRDVDTGDPGPFRGNRVDFRGWTRDPDDQHPFPGRGEQGVTRRWLACDRDSEPKPIPTPGNRAPRWSDGLRAEAQLALERNWVLIPIIRRTKRPVCAWKERPAFSLAELERWVVKHGASVAVRTGSSSGYPGAPCGGGSGLVVIDIDTYAGGVTDPAWSPTVTCVTPRGGLHLYYSWSGDDSIGCSASKLAPHVDVRGRGGIAVLPGSRGASGGVYAWQDGRSPDLMALAPLPKDIVARLLPRPIAPSPTTRFRPILSVLGIERLVPYVAAALRRACAAIEGAEVGARNAVLNRETYALARLAGARATDPEVIERTVLNAALTAGLPEGEARATVRSAMGAGMANPWIPPLLRSRS